MKNESGGKMLRKVSIVLMVFLFLVIGSQAAEWDIDKAHSNFGFSVRHMVITTVKGGFDSFEGTISNFDGNNLAEAQVEVTIDIASIDTNNERRDNHLRSPDFFDSEQFPQMTFKSTKIIPGEDDTFKLVGELTIKGVTKDVTFDCEYHGTVNVMDTEKAGFSAETTINRKDFGILWDKTLDTGALVAGDDVNIMIEVEANKVK